MVTYLEILLDEIRDQHSVIANSTPELIDESKGGDILCTGELDDRRQDVRIVHAVTRKSVANEGLKSAQGHFSLPRVIIRETNWRQTARIRHISHNAYAVATAITGEASDVLKNSKNVQDERPPGYFIVDVCGKCNVQASGAVAR